MKTLANMQQEGMCVCACDAQIFQLLLKLRGSITMRRNHEFFCFVALLQEVG